MKKIKVYLSPSVQHANLYAFGLGTEAHWMKRIVSRVKQLLEMTEKFEVFTSNPSMKLDDIVKHSNKKRVEAHVSVHSNAGGGDGTLVLVDPTNFKSFTIGNIIYQQVAPLSPGKDDGVRDGRHLFEIHKVKAPAKTLIEVAFHDGKESKWITTNVDELAIAIAKGICKYFKVKLAPPYHST